MKKVSRKTYATYSNFATVEKDYATINLLKWYIDEQVEEEKNDTEMLAKLKIVGENPATLFMLDSIVGKRELSAASDFTKI